MKLSTTLAFGALLLCDASFAQVFQFRPEVLENNTTWPMKGARLKISGESKEELPDKCKLPRESYLGKFFSPILGDKKHKCKQVDIAAGDTLKGFPHFPERQIHAFTFPNQTFILHVDTPGLFEVRTAREKNTWTRIPGGMTVTCYEGNEGLPHCVFRD
ncbi:hypothetical protein F52700_1958 [Fusarium sp. NRRL 52700]|nr:hypothetical protein F52700_1958 [Fusarium sp. NRRL 52700]